MSVETEQTHALSKLADYLRRQGGQCNAQQPIVPVAGSELLKAADELERLSAERMQLREALVVSNEAFTRAIAEIAALKGTETRHWLRLASETCRAALSNTAENG